MGCCDIIPNNSVHWNISHEKENGAHKARPARDASSPTDEPGDVITIEDRVARGKDPVSHGIGKGKNHHGQPQGHPDKLRVTLRFQTLNEAVEALQAAADEANEAIAKGAKADGNTGLFEVRLGVKAKPTIESNTFKHPRNPYAQVCVEW